MLSSVLASPKRAGMGDVFAEASAMPARIYFKSFALPMSVVSCLKAATAAALTFLALASTLAGDSGPSSFEIHSNLTRAS